MADKVWLTDSEVGKRFGSTRQWVWGQVKSNPIFLQFAAIHLTNYFFVRVLRRVLQTPLFKITQSYAD